MNIKKNELKVNLNSHSVSDFLVPMLCMGTGSAALCTATRGARSVQAGIPPLSGGTKS